MIVQNNLSKSTTQLNGAIERMTTGYKINHASDNAAGYSIAKNWEARLGSLDVAADNAATGADMLATLEDTYALISTHVQRVRDLTEQAGNGTYGQQSLEAIKSEITARLEEINRIAANCEYNGIYMMDGTTPQATSGIDIQVGIDSQDTKSKIHLDKDLFAGGNIEHLFKVTGDNAYTPTGDDAAEMIDNLASACAGLSEDYSASDMLGTIDDVITKISSRITKLGAAQNRIDSAVESISVQTENITSSLSTLRDADVATESSNYIKAQILQQAAATLLATANQTPSIALNLI
jgi:flagellin